jgi:hypothetical protein
MLLRKNSVKSGLEEQSFLHSSIIIVRFQKKLRLYPNFFQNFFSLCADLSLILLSLLISTLHFEIVLLYCLRLILGRMEQQKRLATYYTSRPFER